MRLTVLLPVDEEMSQFIQEQGVDPSALVSKLFREDITRQGIRIDPQLKAEIRDDELLQESELMLDADTLPAG